ncbi:MAG: cysteinyl-tRNA synthetase [Cyanobacteria bacterium RYN_339]|nr:cysteinyl-tRNA synthetase [Cyanobacteria bacterium RYN_339]
MLRLTNNLTRQKEEFQPLEPGKVKMYVCGPTVYGLLHIGNGRTFMFWDVARRYLEHRGYEVMYVQNFTDIDDKIINRAAEEGISAADVAEKYTLAYFEDMDGLGLRRATHYPRATDHVEHMVAHIQGLVDKGLAYPVDGDVYYRVARFEGYGKLSGRKTEDNEAGARVDVDKRKEDASDFALWKAAKPGEPAWESPWGKGRPGWHIECSAMVRDLMGDTIDIHAGGVDLKFPHHENEIAQSEGLTEQPFVRFWMHTAFLNFELVKMSKSVGNIKTVRDMLQAFGAQALRIFFLQTHYSQELTFSEEAIKAAEAGWLKLRKTLARIEQGPEALGTGDDEVRALQAGLVEAFNTAMDDDFNTPAAIAQFFETGDALRRLRAKGASAVLVADVVARMRELADVVGLDLSAPDVADVELGDELTTGLLDTLVSIRAEAKATKNWALADKVRNDLKALGVQLVDQKDGSTSWEIIPRVLA